MSPASDDEGVDQLYDSDEDAGSDASEFTPPPGADDPEGLQLFMDRITEGQLEDPEHQVMDCKRLYEMVKDGSIDLDPSYQRDVVWSTTKQVGLVESLMLKYYVPPIIFALINIRTLQEKYICIDGKQRVTSIIRFMDGEIPYSRPGSKEKFWWSDVGAPGKRKVLPGPLKKLFEKIKLPSVTYKELRDDQQRDIFQRVQLGVALSSAEKLQAISSPRSSWITFLERKYIDGESGTLKGLIDWDLKRAKGFQNTAFFVCLASMNFDKRQKAENSRSSGRSTWTSGFENCSPVMVPTTGKLKTFLERPDEPNDAFKAKVELALAIWVKIGQEFGQTAFHTVSSRVSPVESMFIPYVIFTHAAHLTIPQLAKVIGNLRVEIHTKHHGNVLTNAKTAQTFSDWLLKTPASIAKQVGNKEERQFAAEECEKEVHVGVPVNGEGPAKKKRRKG
ncbi:hypothetical protein, variant [Cryptococcus amylolentus CBS 6039]|uniref:GmrSD restriction endonucleases N-terminal domain-containing protein n=1 Tax=Cryptococcus amylolentus CBS 6039 TaxID=1295533 RepID=A0A1E3HVZ3_9TREE|nr:hypothetical protein, variant [Cryptococcus amylolentus CBS 6039]ODN80489.1 hypothetical protein, variant [Cryptococcus amylolentus CBS 6039]